MLRRLTASACAVAVAATGTGAVERHQVRDVGLPPRNGLTTAVFDPARFGSASPEKHFARAVVSGASAVRLSLYWPSVAPSAEGGASFDPSDPVKYDFALCHLGMLQHCPSRRDPVRWEGCGVKPVCRHWDE